MPEESRVTYSQHAREQMVARQVSASQVERTIASPTHRYPSMNPPGRIVAESTTAMGATLRVVYVEQRTSEGRINHVITVIRIGRQRR